MAVQLPAGAPQTLGEAFAYINSVTAPTLDDLKVMVLLEAAGLDLYRSTASGTDDPELVSIFDHNGREEMAHAHRVAKAIEAISGEAFPPPAAADNPYLDGPMLEFAVTAEGLKGLAQAEFAGEQLYESWAASTSNPEAARLFRLNGKEEADHGRRMLQAAALLEA